MGKNLIQQRRGKGTLTFKSPGFKFLGVVKRRNNESLTILDILNCPGHSAPLAKVVYDDNTQGLILAPETIKVGDQLNAGTKAQRQIGHCMCLKDIPEGTMVHNIEASPGDGGKFVRASGTFAKVSTKLKTKIIVIFPSKKKKEFHPNCQATIGSIAGSGRTEKPFVKAGIKYKVMSAKNKFWPKVSGSAMNAVAHPFGNKRSSRKSKARPVPKNAPPGRKVGMLRPKRTGRRGKKR